MLNYFILFALAALVAGQTAIKDPLCPTENHLGEKLFHLRHADCTKFYKCDHGKTLEFQCQNGAYFNKKYDICDHPRNVECTPKKIECPKKNSPKLIHLQHETDCAKFYKCNFGVPLEFTCPPGQMFMPGADICGKNVKCNLHS